MQDNYGILYLTYDGLTDPLGQSQILPYLIGLSKYNYSIHIVSFEKENRYAKTGVEIKSLCDANGIVWHPLKYHKSPPVLSTLFDVWQLARRTKRICKNHAIKIVHCRSYITSLVGITLKEKYGVKFIFDMRGFWADERVEGGLWNLKNPLYKSIYDYFKRKEKVFLNESDCVVSLTKNAEDEIKRYGTKSPVHVIPTCVDMSFFDPARVRKEDVEALRSKVGLNPTDIVLLYLGSWGTWYLTDEMLSFFKQFKRKFNRGKFLIVTPDPVDIQGYELAEDVIIQSAGRAEVPVFISLASFSVFFIKPTFSKKASAATKMGELLAMDTTVITNRGWGDVEEIVSATGSYFQDEFLSTEIDINFRPQTRSYCTNNLSLDVGVQKYKVIYDQLSK